MLLVQHVLYGISHVCLDLHTPLRLPYVLAVAPPYGDAIFNTPIIIQGSHFQNLSSLACIVDGQVFSCVRSDNY